MKKTSVIFALVLFLFSCKDNNSNFSLKGTLIDSNGETLYLEKLVNPQPIIVDSTSIDEEGNFEFENYVPTIGYYRLKINDMNFAFLVLDSNEKVVVKGSAKDLSNTYEVEGSQQSKLFREFNKFARENKFQTDSLNIAFQTAMQSIKMDSLKMDSLSKIFKPIYDNMMDKYFGQISEKIKGNLESYACLFWVQWLDPDKYADVYTSLDKSLYTKYPNDKMVRQMHELITKELALRIGSDAPEINLPTPSGENLALSSLKGKVVLIDFWASWCGPCRKEMPFVVNLYKQYKNQGFEIYGVSLDKDKDAWIAAIEKDGITWPQVSDLKFWESDAAHLYSVSGIPYTVLLDKEGKIIAKGLRGLELEEAVKNAFK